MSVTVAASKAEVEAALAADPALSELLPAVSLHEKELSPPRRSLEELPLVVTVVDYLATALATNIAYDIGKKVLVDALARHFGKDKVKDSSKSGDDPASA